jgi:hypothetical protein
MVVQAIIWSVVITGFSLLLVGMIFGEPETTEDKFKVVDNYKDCQVIQYSPSNAARYQYFLHCP